MPSWHDSGDCATLVFIRRPRSVAGATRHSPELGIVTEPMGIGLCDLAPFSVMAKQRAETGGRHRLSPMAALERDEQRG